MLKMAVKKGKIFTRDIVRDFGVSRQYASGLLASLVAVGQLIKIGSTKTAFYILPAYARLHPKILPSRYEKTFKNGSLEEHEILDRIERAFLPIKKLPENIKDIFTYAFSEMLNNAIEHSRSKNIRIVVSVENKILAFTVEDFGIGVFRNIMRKRGLKSPLEAVQDLLKGKTTTMPKAHSGEGIFFTSKAGDLFVLDSFGERLIIDNLSGDVLVEKAEKIKKGTRVEFKLNSGSSRHLTDIFREYTDMGANSDYGFNKTEVRIKLYTMGGVHISRSQARRVLAGLEKFKVVMFDFDKVPVVGQAFADEIFRVFHNKHTNIKLEVENMNEGVRFMVRRAMGEAKVDKDNIK